MTWSRAMRLRTLYLVISLLLRLELSRGVLVNRTIDDQFGDLVTGVPPTYGGNEWKQGATCMKCSARPDPSRVFQNSWHDATWLQGDSSEDMMTVNFNGSAVYVFIILANNLGRTTTSTSLSFSLDGEIVGNYMHSPNPSTDYEYNVTAYANDSLVDAQHTLVMQTAGDAATLVLFDYVIYSVDDDIPEESPSSGLNPSSASGQSGSSSGSTPSPTSASTKNSPSVTTATFVSATSSAPVDSLPESGKKDIKVIVGALIGGLVAFTLANGLLLYRCRRKKNTVATRKNYSSYVHSGRTLTGPLESSDWGETFTGTRMSSSMLPSTQATSTFHDRSSFIRSTIMSQDQRPSRGRMMYIQDASSDSPELQARTKSAERRLDLARQVAYVGRNRSLAFPRAVLDLGSRQALRGLEMRPREDIDDTEILQEQIVLLLNEVDRLLAQREMAETFRARDER